MENLFEKTNYLNKEIKYLKNVKIQEFDIRSAALSAIKTGKLLSEDRIKKLESLPKLKRNIQIGLEIKRNPELGEKISKLLETARKCFIEANKIPEASILSIKKDAIFIINCKIEKTKFMSFEFVLKNQYTSYAYINKKEFYFNSEKMQLDVKGISEVSKEQGKDFILKDIGKILKCGEKLTQVQLFNYLKRYRSEYLNRKVNKETYREIDSEYFRYKENLLDDISDEMVKEIDISQNYINYVIPLISLML